MTDDMQIKALAKEIEFLRGKIDEIRKLTDDGFFNEAIYDDRGNFDQNDETKTNKLKKALEGI